MELYKRFIIVAAAIICAAAAVCGGLIAKDNTERRLYGTNEQILTEGAVFTRLPFQPITQTPLTGPVGTDFPGTDRSIRPGESFSGEQTLTRRLPPPSAIEIPHRCGTYRGISAPPP